MKKAVVIINLHSGKHKKKKKIDINKFIKIFNDKDYDVEIYTTKYRLHAKEIVENLPNDIDLVISVGGDGTFNEVVSGNLNREKKLVLSHLPYGTTNDIGAMFSLGKNIEKNINKILDGEIRKIDICKVNDRYSVYVAGFGKFMNVPYETPRNLKKKIGYFAYLFEGAKELFRVKTHLYELNYEVDGEKYQGLYSFILISNANRIAGINNFYKDVKLDDNKFEVLLCNLKTKKDIMRSLFYLKTNDITKVPGFYFHKTDHIRITFKEKLKQKWCVDGESMDEDTDTYDISIVQGLEMMLPKTISKELFVDE